MLSECMRTSFTHLVTDDLGKRARTMSSLTKFFYMPRILQCQNIDSLIQGINTIIENRCSLSDEDVKILNDAKAHLELLKRKKGKTNKDILKTLVKVVELLSKFFVGN